MKERWTDWSTHGYPVVIFVDESCPDKYAAQCVDMPGCMTQAPTIDAVLHKLDAIVPQFLVALQHLGVSVPEPSTAHGFSCQSIEWATPKEER